MKSIGLNMERLGFGIVSWGRFERIEKRYGYIVLRSKPYGDAVVESVTSDIDESLLQSFQGARVKIMCRVIESRKSGHCGDMFLGIFPTQPSVGDVIELGIGMLCTLPGKGCAGEVQFGLAPYDARRELWIDPHLLYRLHDQTVEVFVERTVEQSHAVPVIRKKADGTIATGNGEI